MKFSAWKKGIKVEKDFFKALEVLVEMFDKIAISSHGDPELFQRRMQNFQNSPQFETYIDRAVRRMVTPVSVSNMATWRQAAKKATRGRFLYELLMAERDQNLRLSMEAQITENVGLIRTLPMDVANKVVHDITEEALLGRRADTIAKIIKDKTDQHARASARLIARTEVNKTRTALTKARSEELGLKWYVWRTALDGDRVRKSHREMEDVLVAWSNPPSPEELVGEKNVGHYHAGNIYNCRCYAEPLLEIDDVDWPHKVYYNGQIQKMRRSEFEQLL